LFLELVLKNRSKSKLYFASDVVAEFAVTLTLNTIKRVSESIEDARNGKWVLGDLFWMCGSSIFEQTVGIFGLGRIGIKNCNLIAKRHCIIFKLF